MALKISSWTFFSILILSLSAIVGCGDPSVNDSQAREVEEVNPSIAAKEPTASVQQKPRQPAEEAVGELESSKETPFKDKQWLDISKIYRTVDSEETFAFVVLDDRSGEEKSRGNYVMVAKDDSAEKLPAELFAKIKKQCLAAESRMLNPESKQDIKDAFFQFNEALSQLPEPAEKWNATGWILSRLGELYFRIGAYEESLPVFDDLMWAPGTIGNPWLHLRKGQVLYEVGEKDAAMQELFRAYMGGGKEIFALEDPKYFQFLETKLDDLTDGLSRQISGNRK